MEVQTIEHEGAEAVAGFAVVRGRTLWLARRGEATKVGLSKATLERLLRAAAGALAPTARAKAMPARLGVPSPGPPPPAARAAAPTAREAAGCDTGAPLG